jgi:ribonuclease T2
MGADGRCRVLVGRSARRTAAGLGSAALLLAIGLSAAHAEVAISGSFTATQTCPAFQSFRKSSNPGDVQVERNKAYEVIAKNKPDATHYRIIVEGAKPRERWVSSSCGHVETGDNEPQAVPQPPGTVGTRATHILAIGWEPAFCEQHRDKSECGELTSSSFVSTHLSLHGLWPQPRGRQYCEVAPDVRELDHNHVWNALPNPEISPETLRRLAAVMPGVQSNLQRHEWIVHGTCFGGSADDYFARASGLAEAVNGSGVAKLFADNAGKNLSADAIRSAFDDAFGAGAGARVTVSCHGNGDNRTITELIINLAGDVKGSTGLGDLMHAALPVPPGCPVGLVAHAPMN